MKNPPHLPEELLIEIFSRLPGKSVGRFSCLSKSWRTNLSTSQFVKLHHSRGSSSHLIRSVRDLHILNYNDDGTLVQRKLKIYAGIGGYCNGLVLLWRRDECIVVNPLTLEQVTINHKPLPGDPDIALTTYGFGYDSCSDDYKIVKLTSNYRDRLELRTFVDVYSLKKSSWNRITDIPYFVPPISSNNGVFVNGAICWFAIHGPSEDPRLAIVAFDVASESFRDIPGPRVIPAPAPLIELTLHCKLFVNGGGLLLLYNGDIWMMEECGQENSWTKFPKAITFGPWCVVKPLFLVGDNEVVLGREGSLIVWNIIDGTSKNLIVVAAHNVIGGITYVESLVSPSNISLLIRERFGATGSQNN